jgi:hypothetical protein
MNPAAPGDASGFFCINGVRPGGLPFELRKTCPRAQNRLRPRFDGEPPLPPQIDRNREFVGEILRCEMCPPGTRGDDGAERAIASV